MELIFRLEQLDQFEGPMDLLLSIVKKNKYVIKNLPIVALCDQFLAYIDQVEQFDMELTGEFIVFASELLYMKSAFMLPRVPEEAEEKKRQLENALLIYQQAKAAALDMQKLYDDYSGRYAKETDEIPPEKGFPLGLDPDLLTRAMHTMLVRLRETTEKTPQKLITPLVNRKTVSVEKRIEHVLALLSKRERATLFAILADSEDRTELIATFLGVLELMKIGQILLLQPEEEEPAAPYGLEDGLTLLFTLNPDYVPDEKRESEFDHDGDEQS